MASLAGGNKRVSARGGATGAPTAARGGRGGTVGTGGGGSSARREADNHQQGGDSSDDDDGSEQQQARQDGDNDGSQEDQPTQQRAGDAEDERTSREAQMLQMMEQMRLQIEQLTRRSSGPQHQLGEPSPSPGSVGAPASPAPPPGGAQTVAAAASAPHARQAPPGGASDRAARRTTSQPRKLTYAEASVPRALEDWLYDVELYCEQLELPAGEAWIREARFVTDRDLWEWWEEYRLQAQQRGAPISTWADFASALRGQFVATGERRAAIDDLCDVKQRAGETINAYFLRVAQLHGRARRDMQDATVMRLALARVRRDEWPFTYSKAIAAVEAGAVTSLAALRALMQQEALAEPGKARSAAGNSSNSSSSSGAPQTAAAAAAGAPARSRGGNWQTQRKKVAAASRYPLPDDDDDQERDDAQEEGAPAAGVHVNAASSARAPNTDAGLRKCFRCNTPGHIAAHCSEPDRRACHRCGVAGHRAAECRAPTPAPKSAPSTSAAATKGARSKNE